ncbi:MAG: XdhC family protein [Saccharospirillaceae bacterium]|nr:XdhC family protein [Pseudomonadales bacterium]NRB78760.1 XdhC family protein [Saccharospirillaceae bacterium]
MNHIQQILQKWYSRRNECQWVLASITHVVGSSYRKPGAMMLMNQYGEKFGQLSGGCIENDLLKQCHKVLSTGKDIQVLYDARSQSDESWFLGCGGCVDICLQTVSQENAYQQLDKLLDSLKQRKTSYYQINPQQQNKLSLKANLQNAFVIKTLPHLLIFGGGQDAIPMVNIAKQMGWLVSLVDPRSLFGKLSDFPMVDNLFGQPALSLDQSFLKSIDGAIVMSHQLHLDAQAIEVLQNSSAKYIGLLGPTDRKKKVLKLVAKPITKNITGPMGLAIGGELPEAIALATISQCHQVLFAKATVCLS